MSYYLLFLDFDGTLKQEPYDIPEANKKAILKACQMGKKIVIASGRNKDMVLEKVRELKLDQFGVSYSIALNGAHIIENTTGKTLHTTTIPLDITCRLFKMANELEISCHVYTENLVYFNYHDTQFEWYQNEGCTCLLIDPTKHNFGIIETPIKFFLFSKDPSRLKKYKDEVQSFTKDIMTAEFSSKYSLEYTSHFASKGMGVQYVCNLYGLPLSQAIAAGDGENDISMIKMAGLGVAMKNGLDSVKAIADVITSKTCTEHGVAEIIDQYLLT